MLDQVPVALSRRHYMDAILVVLDRRGGSGLVSDVQDAVRHLLDRYMTEVDLGPVRSNPNDPRWENDTRWARRQLVDDGLLHPPRVAGWGVWRLTPRGQAAVATAAARLSGSPSSRGGGRTENERPMTVPVDASRQLTFLAEVFRRAHQTPVGSVAHPALLDVVAMLEALLQGRRPTTERQSTAVVSLSPARTSTPGWRPPPTPTTTLIPNYMDAQRMRAFMDGPWAEAVQRMYRWSDAEKAARIHEIDLLAALPPVASLVAARSGWLLPTEAGALAARGVHRVMTEALRPGGLIGGLPLAQVPMMKVAIRDGLFHRVLTGWVHHIDTTGDDGLLLRGAPLRSWLVGLRSLSGDPQGNGPRGLDPLWAWLFETDPTIEPPRDGGVEELANELAEWLSALVTSPASDAPAQGDLLWHRLLGWAVAIGDSRSRFDPNFSAYILSSSETMRLKFASKAGWIDVTRLSSDPSAPAVIREAAVRVAEVARAAWGVRV